MHVFLTLSLLFFISFARAEECPKGSYWVKPFPRSDYHRADGTYVSAADVTGHCRSQSGAYEYWSKQLKNGRPSGWPHKAEKSKDWSRHEMEIVLTAFEKVPKGLWEKVTVFRMGQSKDMGNEASSAEKVLVIYDYFFREDRVQKILTHELAHEWFRGMSSTEGTEFLKIAKWRHVKIKDSSGTIIERWKSFKPRHSKSDGETSPEEDFANGVETFVHDRTRLKTKDPDIEKWLFKKYDDKLKVR